MIQFFIIIILSIYVFYGLVLYFGQEKLIFYPVEYNQNEIKKIEKEIQHFQFKTYTKNKEIRITYWESEPKSDIFKMILYFGGNAENTNYTAIEISEHPELLSYKWILVNYPGYNGSSGIPSEKNFYIMAEEIYDFLNNLYKDRIKESIVIGRSIGTAVASYLCVVKKTKKLILITPFDSIKNIGKSLFPFYPFSFLIKHKFPTIDYIKKIENPIFILIAEYDEIIPESSTKNLLKAIANKKNTNVYTIKDSNHNTISNSQEYWIYLKNFLEK